MTIRQIGLVAAIFGMVALLCFVQQVVSLKRFRRSRQVALPILSLLFCVTMVVTVVRRFDGISAYIMTLFDESEILGALLSRIELQDGTLPELLYGLVLKVFVIAFNFILPIGFLLVKVILLPIVNHFWSNKTLTEKTAGFIYEYDDDLSEWFLRKPWANIRALALPMLICSAAICGTWISAFFFLKLTSPFLLLCFPAAVLIVAGEVFSFLNGQTRAEFLTEILGENADSRRVSQFNRMRGIYEKTFPDQILVARTGSEFTGESSAADLLKRLAKGNRTDRMTAGYFSLCGQSFKPDLDYVMATHRLMRGESLAFLNPFYRDLGVYLALPLSKTLLDGKKCLVITGRNSAFADTMQWLQTILDDFSNLHTLWRIHELDAYETECDIGVMSSRHMYNMDVYKANREFLSQAGMVLLIEPSLMVNIGQVGFNTIVDQIHNGTKKPVFCILDRNVDGLADTMSHILRTEITEVIAPPVPRCIYSGMMWNAGGDYGRQSLFDKQTRYLGNGMELAAVAVKNQIPKVLWCSETKAPVRDIHWIAGQYHPTICRYMNIPSQQANLYDKVAVASNIWNVSVLEEAFIIVEDEFCNMFSTLRTYLSRGREQAFINVLSENYILRDYMRCNGQLFFTDPVAVPCFVPDYAKTLRNAVIKLMLKMTVHPVREDEVLHELHLAGHASNNAFESLTELSETFFGADQTLFTIGAENCDENGLLSDVTNCYSIRPEMFANTFADSLKSAYFIIEDEKTHSNYLDAKLFGHVTQIVLPGQFLTYDGKYYRAEIVTPEKGVILRRASDLYDTRKYYRQIRKYNIDKSSQDITNIRKVMDVEIAYLRASFTVDTTGYLEMTDYSDLRTARMIDFSDDPQSYSRSYHNKTIMRLHFPGTNDRVRFTVCILMMEVLRSLLPQTWHYVAVTATRPDDVDGMLNTLVYDIGGDMTDKYIYVIEDSEVDLGLLETIDKNLLQILEIIADYLDWHFEKMREHPETEPTAPPTAESTAEPPTQPSTQPTAESTAPPETEPSVPPSETAQKPGEYSGDLLLPHADDDAELAHIDQTDIFDENMANSDSQWLEENFEKAGIRPAAKTRYQSECYLKFGFDDIDARVRVEEVRNYLRIRGFTNNNLTKARRSDPAVHCEIDAENHCDFCAMPLTGISYDKISDGRIRCRDCSASGVDTLDEARELFYRIRELLGCFYGIRFNVPIGVKITDARTIAKSIGRVFRPSQKVASRAMGYAKKHKDRYFLCMESGCPRLSFIDTMVHELTHIWQYKNWDERVMERIYGSAKNKDLVYEGMAVWAAIQYMYHIGESSYAAQQEALMMRDDSVYGEGFRMFIDKYPFVKDFSSLKVSPFVSLPPL